jgi:predicted DNA-binding transcriptional regulator AlpA
MPIPAPPQERRIPPERRKQGATNAIEFNEKSKINKPGRFSAAHNGPVAGPGPVGATSLRGFAVRVAQEAGWTLSRAVAADRLDPTVQFVRSGTLELPSVSSDLPLTLAKSFYVTRHCRGDGMEREGRETLHVTSRGHHGNERLPAPGPLPRQDALPPTLEPRLISRESAAAYICVTPNTFDGMVREGRMPRPRLLGERRRAWDVRELDLAIDRLPFDGNDAGIDETWSDVDAPEAAALL